VLASMYGRAPTGDCWQYVSHYAPDDPRRAIREAANEIGPILELILKEDETDDC